MTQEEKCETNQTRKLTPLLVIYENKFTKNKYHRKEPVTTTELQAQHILLLHQIQLCNTVKEEKHHRSLPFGKNNLRKCLKIGMEFGKIAF